MFAETNIGSTVPFCEVNSAIVLSTLWLQADTLVDLVPGLQCLALQIPAQSSSRWPCCLSFTFQDSGIAPSAPVHNPAHNSNSLS